MFSGYLVHVFASLTWYIELQRVWVPLLECRYLYDLALFVHHYLNAVFVPNGVV